jgi:AcrR family transcriptional regulator
MARPRINGVPRAGGTPRINGAARASGVRRADGTARVGGAQRPRANGAETRERILQVALELFGEHGYDATSLRDIAERLGITKAALYYYFPRKADILLELHWRMHQAGRKLLEAIEQIDDGPERYAAWPAVLERAIDVIEANRDQITLYASSANALRDLDDLANDERNRAENEDLQQRLLRLFNSSKLPLTQRVRMLAALGLVMQLLMAGDHIFPDLSPDELIAELKPIVADILGEAGQRAAADAATPAATAAPSKAATAPSGKAASGTAASSTTPSGTAAAS